MTSLPAFLLYLSFHSAVGGKLLSLLIWCNRALYDILMIFLLWNVKGSLGFMRQTLLQYCEILDHVEGSSCLICVSECLSTEKWVLLESAGGRNMSAISWNFVLDMWEQHCTFHKLATWFHKVLGNVDSRDGQQPACNSGLLMSYM